MTVRNRPCGHQKRRPRRRPPLERTQKTSAGGTRASGTPLDGPRTSNFLILLAVFGGLAFKMTTPADRAGYLSAAVDFVRQLRVAAIQPRPKYDAFRDALRQRTRDLLVTPALVTFGAAVFTAMLFGAGAIGDAGTLVGMGASVGSRTTNGEWWRLLTSAFVYTGMLHLIVSLAVVAQLGAVLERLAGRLAFGAVYLMAAVFTGLVNLSAHPVAVTVGASGAIFGLYGLLLASILWQTVDRVLHRRAGAPDPEEDGDPGGRRVYSGMLHSTDSPEKARLRRRGVRDLQRNRRLRHLGRIHRVGRRSGLRARGLRRAGNQTPAARPVGAVLAAAVVLAAACAIPLRNIADVAPEITRVVATEERTATTYQAASAAFKKEHISAEALAQVAERKIVPELQAGDARLAALRNVPLEFQPLVADAREYLRLRSSAWRLRVAAIRKTNADPLRGSERTMDAGSRLEAQARFRSDQAAMGNAEGAERASLEAFRRVKGATTPPTAVVLADAR